MIKYEKKRLAKLGNKNGMWKDNKVTYISLHQWINDNKPKPDDGKCEECYNKQYHDAACVTGIYDRDFINWKYLCRSCHMKQDGRIYNLRQYRITI